MSITVAPAPIRTPIVNITDPSQPSRKFDVQINRDWAAYFSQSNVNQLSQITVNVGTITLGTIGGWTITSTQFSDTAGTVGMSSAVTGGDDIRFWAGSTNPAAGLWRVYESGLMIASSGYIGDATNGWSIGASGITANGTSIIQTSASATTGIKINSSAIAGYNGTAQTMNLATDGSGWVGLTGTRAISWTTGGTVTAGGCVLAAGSISSTTFTSGPLGAGWRIANDGSAEFQNATIRGVLRTSVFEKDTVSAVNGIFIISKADVLAADMTALDASTMTIKGDTTFVANECLIIKDGVDDERLLVTDASAAPTYTVTRDAAASYSANANPAWKAGTSVVSTGVGSGTKTGFIWMDASSGYSPYIDVWGRNSTTYNDYTLHARLGWLKGITDATVGLSSTDVWGLYSDSVYLKGTLSCGAGAVIAGDDGIGIKGVASWVDANSLSFTNSSGGVLSYITNLSATVGAMLIFNGHDGSAALSSAADMAIRNYAASGYQSRQYLGAYSGGDSSTLVFAADDGDYEPYVTLDINGYTRFTITHGGHPILYDASANAISIFKGAAIAADAYTTAWSVGDSQDKIQWNNFRARINALEARLQGNNLIG